ncbi:acyl-CoA dehydrogenase family protein [Cupriavidus taiwanensis]|uniref:acyl-CoA dehydrogenase family protein n=1 Tax=Cupriavidus taiwanensis TaxID=164546 RepID=UPI000E104BE8|nr:acyl-CoA dehydrogenase family protein [Cupriavidus taiwanensis]SOY63593.1 Acyl-CoA dehydrogenase [Cupriavidus taiwanensis]SOY63594.1 Acyl-CoA dehydrogenase [Cupriavidus taiwanensis]SOY93749.1 Acyl-CoA dehydrogenase [Cupriavidus taiwanensis]SOZ77381.1 Acyl-CoA dehydrogenase [Cupriavidus taiwanensis]SOZ85428.1 Acyl-CoA dehydrogenase [Cupriavidus taiwanensis]
MEATLDTLPLVTIPPEDEALRGPIRAFLQEALRDVPAPVRARTWMGFDGEFSRALARQGWIGLSLPREYGGAGRSAFARFVLVEELIAAGAPVSAHWFADRQTAPLILRYGSEAQKHFFLPRLIRGEIFICIGMSEPDTGSDLSSVRTRAVRTETGWRLNGRKIWTTNAHRAQYMCALVRTSGQHGDRHQGLSQVLIDLSLPGISARPIRDLAGDGHFCEVVFEDVELPADALVGEEGSGWKQVTAELAFERSGPERILTSLMLAETWLAEVRASCLPVPASVRAIAGRIAGRMAVLRAMSLAVAERLDQGQNPEIDASYVKDLGTEFEQELPGWISTALEQMPDFAPSDDLLRAHAYITQLAPSFSLRGGTRQILRGIIARSLGLR